MADTSRLPKNPRALALYIASTYIQKKVESLLEAEKAKQEKTQQRQQQLLEQAKQNRQAKEQAQAEKDRAGKSEELSPAQTLLARRHDQSHGKGNDGINMNIETEQGRCFHEDHFSPEKPLQRLAANTRLQADPGLLGQLQRKGNTPEQEDQLLRIYGHKPEQPEPGQSPAVNDYRSFMYNVAIKHGREVMDRGQAADKALATDQQAFAAIAQQHGYEKSEAAIAFASPNIANLNDSQISSYLREVSQPSQEPINSLQMARNFRGGRDSRGEADESIVLQHNYHLDNSPPSERDKRMFAAEEIDLAAHRWPGQHIDADGEYLRQLGEQIRLTGRQGLSASKEECKEHEVSSDQLIAGRMYIAGHNQQDILTAVEKYSPHIADKGQLAKQDYIQSDIEPVVDNTFVRANRTMMQEIKISEKIPTDIKRFDCLERI